MQGRVFTLVGSVSGMMAPLGMAIAGPVADALGVQFWFVMAGMVCVLMAVAAFFIPTLMNLEDANGEQHAEAGSLAPVLVAVEAE